MLHTIYVLFFLTPVPVNKMELFHTLYTYIVLPRLDSRMSRSFSDCAFRLNPIDVTT